jgi:transcriptional regulator with XRE-family HTH domain
VSGESSAGGVPPLRRERELRGWSQQYVAEAIEAPDASYVSRWERGVVSPSPQYRERLCRLFDRNAEELGLLDRPLTGGGADHGEPRPLSSSPGFCADPRRRPRRWRAVALATVLVGAAAAAAGVGLLRPRPAPPATGGAPPALHGCPQDWYCFYAAPGFGGRRLQFRDCGDRQSLEDYGFGLQAASWVNSTRHTVLVYDGGGRHLWTEGGKSMSSDVGALASHRATFFHTVC